MHNQREKAVTIPKLFDCLELASVALSQTGAVFSFCALHTVSAHLQLSFQNSPLHDCTDPSVEPLVAFCSASVGKHLPSASKEHGQQFYKRHPGSPAVVLPHDLMT